MYIVPRVGIFNSSGDRHGQANRVLVGVCMLDVSAGVYHGILSLTRVGVLCIRGWSVMIAPDSVLVRLIDYRIIIVSECE